MKVPAVALMRNVGLEPDPWQVDVLESAHSRILLNCCRQAGKSTVVALLALAEAVWSPATKVLLVSRSLRQSTELFRVITDFYDRFDEPMRSRRTKGELVLDNASRIVCLPCKEETIRGFSGVTLLILDEASRVPDDVYRSVRPMLGVSRGRLICLSTPHGKRGFFYDAWAKGGGDWQRFEVPGTKVRRFPPEYLDEMRRALRETYFRQEYLCSFEALTGRVYPNMPSCVVPGPAPALKRRVGGLDFGFRNPFAAVWGGLDGDGVLWITNEYYCREQAPSQHAAHLPRGITWYADPSGAAQRAELLKAGLAVAKGNAAIEHGISMVHARIQTRTLRIIEGACPNLLAEAELYRYPDSAEEKGSENPISEYNHALDALRYLISRLDNRHLGGPPTPGSPPPPDGKPPEATAKKKTRPWLRYDNEALWTPLNY